MLFLRVGPHKEFVADSTAGRTAGRGRTCYPRKKYMERGRFNRTIAAAKRDEYKQACRPNMNREAWIRRGLMD